MVLDYRERKQVSKNIPKRRPVKIAVLLASGSVLAVFSLGMATGWLLHKSLATSPDASGVQAAGGAKQGLKDNAPATRAQHPPARNGTKNGEPPLTFYYTLPKGEKMVLGSGLNPPLDRQRSKNAATPAQPGEPARANANAQDGNRSASGQANKDEKPGEPGATRGSTNADLSGKTAETGKTATDTKRFTVQAASYDNREDADALKRSLSKSGLPVFVIGAQVPGMGMRFRVRIGSRLDRETADGIAAKIGRGAFVVPE